MREQENKAIMVQNLQRETSKLAEYSEGTIIDNKFKVLSTLGKGGAATVYSVEHLYLGNKYAVKVMNSHLHNQEILVARTQNEAKTLANLIHPNLVKVTDFGLAENELPYVVQELVSGRDLKELTQEEGLISEKQAVNIFLQIIDGISYLHANGIVHRDIKSSNVLIDKDQIKIIDLGIAKSLFDNESAMKTLTKTGEIFGSPY